MDKRINNIFITVLSHIFRMGEQHALPAKTNNNKMFCNYGIYLKKENGEKEKEDYHLYKEGERFLLTTSKRSFDIMVASDVQEYTTKELKVIEDFINKTLS